MTQDIWTTLYVALDRAHESMFAEQSHYTAEEFVNELQLIENAFEWLNEQKEALTT